jgi:hypothetical protein
MEGKSDIKIELETISKLVADIPNVPVFTVPEGYFALFPGKMLLKIKELETEDPANEIIGISPLLAGLDRKMPMQVPGGYFDEIRIPELNRPLAPVFPLKKKGFSMFAVAASVIVVLGFGALLFSQLGSDNSQLPTGNASVELPKLSDKEMDTFLKTFPDLATNDPITAINIPVDVEEMISDVDEEGLHEFLSDLPDVKSDKLN